MTSPLGAGTSGRRSSKAPLIAAVIVGVLLIVGIRYVTTRDDGSTSASSADAPGTAAQQAPR